MKKELKIGIFDSGIGGYSILKEVLNLLPNLETYYIADEAFAPYGEKEDEEVRERCFSLCSTLIEKNVDLIIVACNTATAIGIDALRDEFELPFVGVEPYLNVQNQLPLEQAKIMVLTTDLMGRSKRFDQLKRRLDPELKMDYYSLKALASLVERAYSDGIDKDLIFEIQKELSHIKKESYSHAILGCTHYPLISELIKESLSVETISPCLPVARRVSDLLGKPVGEAKSYFWFMSTRNNNWEQKSLESLSLPWPVLS